MTPIRAVARHRARLLPVQLAKRRPAAKSTLRWIRADLGAITITKSITLNGGTGLAGSRVDPRCPETNGVNIAAGATGVVTLRNVEIQGIGTGLNGISITSAGKVHIENSLVTGFTTRGITDGRTNSGFLYIADSIVRNNGNGIVMAPGAGGSINAVIDRVRSFANATAGFVASGVVFATISNSNGSGNGAGFSTQGGSAEMNLESCVAASNGIGVQNGSGGATTTRLSNCSIYENSAECSKPRLDRCCVLSGENNKIGGNTVGNTGVSAASPGQQ